MYVLTGPTAGKPPGTGAVQKYWNRGLPLIASVSVFWDFGSLFRTLRRHSG